jgi:hypothetical protein
VTSYQIGELMGNAYIKAVRVHVAVNCFRKAGLYPCNWNIFDNREFAEDATLVVSTSSASHSFTTPSDISPVPHPQKSSDQIKNVATTRRGSATLITGSPHKVSSWRTPREQETEKKRTSRRTEEKKLNDENRETKRNITSRKRSNSSSSSTED